MLGFFEAMNAGFMVYEEELSMLWKAVSDSFSLLLSHQSDGGRVLLKIFPVKLLVIGSHGVVKQSQELQKLRN